MAGRSKASEVLPSQLQKVLDDWMDAKGSRDLEELFLPFRNMSWKTSPSKHMEPLLAVHGLWSAILDLAPNGILAPTVVTRAIDASNREAKCNYGLKNSQAFADALSEKIRVALGKFRACRSPAMKVLVSRKLGHKDNEKLEQLLEKLLPEEEQPTASSTATQIEKDSDGFPVFPFTLTRSRSSSVATVEFSAQEEEEKEPHPPVTPRKSSHDLSSFSFFADDTDFMDLVRGTSPVTPREKRSKKKELKDTRTPKKAKAATTKQQPKAKATATKQKPKATATATEQQPKAKATTTKESPEGSRRNSEPTAGPRAAEFGPKTDRKNVHSRAYHKEYQKRLAAFRLQADENEWMLITQNQCH